MIKISKNTPINKQDLIDLLNKILEKNDFWNEVEFIVITDAKTGNPITIRPNNWAMIEVEE